MTSDDLPFELPGFSNHHLAIRFRGVFTQPSLVVDGTERDAKVDLGYLADESGKRRQLLIVPNWLDGMPQIKVDDEKPRRIGPRLRWYEYAWAGIPFVLLVSGGALGVIAAIVALPINARIFRTTAGPRRYLQSGLVSLGAGAFVFVMAVVLQVLIRFASADASP